MSADRYEITDNEPRGVLAIEFRGNTHFLYDEDFAVCAIRQQSRDIELLRAELAAAVAERDTRIAELESVARHAQAVVKVCERDYKDRLQLMTARAERAEARLAAIDAAPVVAVVSPMYGVPYIEILKCGLPPIGTELIAKPAED